tara:strand:+ start:2838 stop:3665 length:828 start_codon:yes stop_codon:yes gene_type:complete
MLAAIKTPMDIKQPDFAAVSVRLAKNALEVEEAQRVRYQVFYDENGAVPCAEMKASGRDFDAYDDFADHLIVLYHADDGDKIVGTYRLLTQEAAQKAGGFYSAQEYDISPLLNSGISLLELGRSCVLEPFRARPVLQMLWRGIADYITERNIDMMFGCASFSGTDVEALKVPLSYMYHYHLAEGDICPRALDERYIDINLMDKGDIDARRAFASLPPIIKGYFRLGGFIGDGAVVDEQFNTTDVLVMVKTQSLTKRYRDHYERKLNKSMPGAGAQ